MKLSSLAFCLAACLASSTTLAHDTGLDYDHVRADRYVSDDRCDYRRPWIHERNHRHHQRVGGAGPCHEIHRGEQLPRFYWSDRYVVQDWRRDHLSAPWRGYHWVRTGNDYVMVSRDTGLIEKVILLRHRR